MLFPYSPVSNYINHNAKSPNAKLQWSSLSKKDWLNRTPQDLAAEPHAGLVMELVALRDIRWEEEVVISYGNDWDKAWRNHVIDWHPLEEDLSSNYTAAAVFNNRVEWLRTEQELEQDPYPDNIMTVCFVGDRRSRPIQVLRDGSKQQNWTYYEGIFNDADESYPCDVLRREESVDLDDAFDRHDSILPADVRYTARVHKEEKGSHVPYTYTNIPRPAIRFFDVPYASDMFLRTAFRHEIHLPDSMVPRAWRDL